MSFGLDKTRKAVILRKSVVRIVKRVVRFKSTADCFRAMGLVQLGDTPTWVFPKRNEKLRQLFPKWYKRMTGER